MITAISWPTPHHRLRRSLSSRRSLLVNAFPNSRHSSRMVSAPNHRPVARRYNRRRAGEARPRGKARSERRKACSHPGGSGFHLPRGLKQRCRLPVLFQQLFHPQHRFFVTFFTEESNVPLVLSLVPVLLASPRKNAVPMQHGGGAVFKQKTDYSATAAVPRISRGTSLCRSAEAAPKHSTMQ